jgi:hypothetical protein
MRYLEPGLLFVVVLIFKFIYILSCVERKRVPIKIAARLRLLQERA